MSQKKPITLEQILPPRSEFKLKKKPGKTYHLRQFTIADMLWIKQEFGSGNALSNMLKEQDWGQIIRMVYHQLVEKEDFLLVKKNVINDMGKYEDIEISGPQLLLESLNGAEEAMAIIGAVTRAITESNQLIKDLVNAEIKKNIKELNLAGVTSLTQLPTSMDTPSSKSAG